VARQFMLGNEAIARAAAESGVRVVAGYPGTPATEIVEQCAACPGIYAEWSANEKHAFEVATAASLTNQRAMAVMKHNGTNAAADFLMHVNFTGVRAGLVLVSADDPGGLSSQCEEDTRILIHTYAHLPVFDPSSVEEAYAMTKAAFSLSEETELVFALRPVMRINHAGGMVEVDSEGGGKPDGQPRPPEFVIDRRRFVMSAVVEKESGGELRPKMRHRWLNAKQAALKAIAEKVDAIVVIGSANSSNTVALEKVARASGCERVVRVNRPEELPDDLEGTVGVTAGASAPEAVVEAVIEKLAPALGTDVVSVTTEDEYFPPPPELRELLRALAAALALTTAAPEGASLDPVGEDRDTSAAHLLDTAGALPAA